MIPARRLMSVSALAIAIGACSGEDPRTSGGSGTTGASGTGGTGTSTGGRMGTSIANIGGLSGSVGIGGARSGGSQAAGGATGGSKAMGGGSMGGSSGAVGIGGASSGGSQAAGGAATVVGGSKATGGMAITGGRTGSSGAPSTGGRDPAGAGGQLGGSSGSGGNAGAATPSSGCGKAPTLASGTRTIQSGGQTRSFMLRIPPNYDRNHPYPLVFAFHWNGGTMGDVDGGGSSGYTWSYYGLREQADKSTASKMIFVAPQGNGNGWANSNGQDLTFVDDMIKQIEGELCVDTTRLFAMGFSYGGGMSYAIACARATVFRAVAVYAGAQLSGCNDGTKPIAYIGVHGITDPTCRIAGGRSLRDRFVKNNGCATQNPPEPSEGSRTHVCTSYSGCSSGHPVRWCAFDGGGHTPAPVDGQAMDSGGGDKTWTKGEVWKFFTQF